jgi:hypothetical protein
MARIVECQIMESTQAMYVSMRDQTDVDNNLRGNFYRNPSYSSLQRVFKAVNRHCTIKIVPDGYGFYLRAKRNHCPTCGDGDALQPAFDLADYIDSH